MINYEGISYNLETIIEFNSLKLLLEALAKKQIEHNKLFCGQNNFNMNKDNKMENRDNNDNNINDEDKFDKMWIDKINNSGLIKEFIEIQKKLLEQNKLINEIKERIDLLEKNRSKLREERLTKKFQNKEKEKDKDNKDIIKKEEQKENDINNRDTKDKIESDKNENEKKESNRYNKSNEKIIVKEIINKPPILEEKNINGPINTDNKTVNIYDIKSKNKIDTSVFNNNIKLEKQITELEEKINSLNERIEEIEQITDNNINDIDINKEGISQLEEKIKKLKNKLNTQISNQEIKNSKEEIKLEDKKEKEIVNDNKENLENELNIFEKKILAILEQKVKEMKNAKSDNNIIKEINSQKEKFKEKTDKILIEINGLKGKDEEIENKLKEYSPLFEIKKINEKMKMLEQDMEEYATKKDIRHVLDETDKYEKELSKFKSFTVNQKETNTKNRDDINKLKNSFSSLKQNFSAINNLFENNSLTTLIESLNNISDNFVGKIDYDNCIRSINKKISEIQMDVNEHNRNWGEIMPKIQTIADIDEFNRMQRKIDELMSKNSNEVNNKALDTEEIIKNIKSIESQVKIFMKKLETENEKEKYQNENCILASRPVGGFKCASCETYIGDVKESNVFLPWNKYHGADRPYRLGSSFSRILQGLNIEQNYNPFLHKIKNENSKRYKLKSESLSVKKKKKIPPINQIIFSEENREKNNTIENSMSNKTIDENIKINEIISLGNTQNNKKKKTLNLNFWGIKSLKNLGNDKNLLTMNIRNKSKKNNNKSFENDKNSKVTEKVIKIRKKIKGNSINNISEENENNLVVPSL